MTPIQQLMLGVGAKKKTYVDDVFSTFLYRGNASDKTVTNNINFDEGGLVWIKNRDQNNTDHALVDTVRGASQYLSSNNTYANTATGANNNFNSFTSTGFTLKDDNGNDFFNKNNTDYASWSFRKAPGFFDIVTYTGNGSNRTIAHSLGCVPGCIMVKKTSGSAGWYVYHRGLLATKYVGLNGSFAAQAVAATFNSTAPTSTHFSLGTDGDVNGNNAEYVAYLFAEGPSDSVAFDGTGDYITAGGHSDYGMGTGDFTVECWVKFDDSANRGVFQMSSTGISSSGGGGDGLAFAHNGSNWHWYANGTSYNSSNTRTVGQWYHVAMCRNSGVTKVFVDGSQIHSFDDTTNYNGTKVSIGGYYSSSYLLKGNVSNFRVVKGTALYTSAFTPPTAALTAITNTKLLCCNNNSVKGSTVDVSDQIVVSGDPQPSSDYPSSFVDSKVFGDSGDQNVIKCGSYVGNGNSDGPDINIGWEPQWILLKRTDSSANWYIWDTMRGIISGSNEVPIYPDATNKEGSDEFMDLTPTGFKLKNNDGDTNASNGEYSYVAIRRPDGYVGKPAAAGTDVFAIDSGAGSTTIPNFDSGFPVDFAFITEPGSTSDFYLGTRLMGGKYVNTHTGQAEAGPATGWDWDSNEGFEAGGYSSSYKGWMWKRHAGLDVVSFTSKGGSGTSFNHSLGRVPEMMLFKNRDRASTDWFVYHKDLHASTPEKYILKMNNNEAVSGPVNDYFDYTGGAGITATTASGGGFFETGGASGERMLCILIASIDGICKVGTYNGSSSTVTVTTGFQPRFVLIKRTSGVGQWSMFDTSRGWGSGNDQLLEFSSNGAQTNNYDAGAPTSTGFTVTSGQSAINSNGDKYIYYAHA